VTRQPSGRGSPGIGPGPARAMVVPMAVVLGIAALLPFLLLIGMSLFEMDLSQGSSQGRFVGLDHYRALFTDERFSSAVGLTMGFVLFGLMIETVVGCAVAVYLHTLAPRLRSLLTTALLVPMLMPPVMVGLTWLFLLQPDYGLVSHGLRAVFGIEGTVLADPRLAMFAVRLVDVWEWTPFVTLVVLAGIESIPAPVLSAAEVDGLTWLQRLKTLYWPATRRLLALIVILRAIDAIKVFDSVYLLTGGGPGTSTELVTLFTYRTAVQQTRIGYGASATVLVTYAVLLLTMLFYRFSGTRHS
jgi:multiple sugar transport system permease protein